MKIVKGDVIMFEEFNRVFEQMQNRKLDILLISKPSNVTYISGYDLSLHIGAIDTFSCGPVIAIIVNESKSTGKTFLLVSELEKKLAAKQNRLDELITYSSFDSRTYIDPKKDYLGKIISVLSKYQINKSIRIGIETANIPFFIEDYIKREFPAFDLVDATDVLNNARLTKTKREIDLIKDVVKLNDAGQDTLLKIAKSNMYEIDIYDSVMGAMERFSGHKPLNIAPLTVELVSGPRTSVVSYPGGPTNRKIERGDTIIFDLSLSQNGYWADTTNTLVVEDNPTIEQLKYFNIAKNVIETAFDNIKPGVKACDIEAKCRKVYESYNILGPCYIGHQIGAAVNEAPIIVFHDQTKIKKDMVFSIEPGAYAGPGGNTGCRLEKMVLVTDSGIEILSNFKWGIK